MSGLMSKIEAVNAVIAVAGDAPVVALDGQYEQAVIAERIIDKLAREVQATSWWFNELNNLKILKTTLGEINLPANTISAEAQGDNGNVVQRGTRMFDRENNTYIFTEDIYVNLIELIQWDDTPQTFRAYIVAKSKEEYNNEYFGSQEVARTVERQLGETYIALKKEDLRSKDINMLSNTRSFNIAFRNRR